MNKFTASVIFLLINYLVACSQTKESTTMIEKYNFEITKNGSENALFNKGNWVIEIYSMPNGYQKEFAPSIEFYQIGKDFFDNGVLKSTCKFLGKVPFGERKLYDEHGKLIEVIDEDKKFGKIKPRDLIETLEKIGLFNRETGENIIVDKILPIDGNFYRTIIHHMDILFIPADTEWTDVPPMCWIVSYMEGFTEVKYFIDGNTGQYTVQRTNIGFVQ